jgi:CARDB
MKKKVILVRTITLIIIAIILLIFWINNSGEPRDDMRCTHDANCTSEVLDSFCSANNSACEFSITKRCLNPGTDESRCIPTNCYTICTDCNNTCEEGLCILKPDLIIARILNVSYQVNNSISFYPIIKNIGSADSDSTKLRVIISDGPISILDVPALAPNMEASINPIYFVKAGGTQYTFDSYVDYLDNIDEINEDNNNFTFEFFN